MTAEQRKWLHVARMEGMPFGIARDMIAAQNGIPLTEANKLMAEYMEECGVNTKPTQEKTLFQEFMALLGFN